MRIAHVTATFPPHYAGTGMVCYHNALGLARLGHEVTVFTADYPPCRPVYPKEMEVQRLKPWFRVGNAPLLPGLLQIAGFDLIHLHYPFYFGAELVFYKSLRSGSPYVLTYHQDVLFPGPLRFPEKLHYHLVGKRILERASKVLATSWDYARSSRLRELLQRKPAAVDELPNGVDTERFHPAVDARALRAHYGLAADERVVLFVGALDRAHFFKGVAVLLQALAHVRDRHVRLLIVGDGNLRPAYERHASLLGLDKRVIFCGRVSDAELPAHYALCDLLVLPSTTMGEAFGLVLLEAMACGKPVIASNLPGVRSVVHDGKDGLLAQPGDVHDLADKMRMMLDDPRRRHEMGELGRAKVEEKYAWHKIIPRLAQVYEEVLQEQR
ncbi:MAG: glycosyltransferase family 4 protein [Chloroflexi bacterium]|nr:glycosyltransferase family 4 protein [Chloroflexota bacterium]